MYVEVSLTLIKNDGKLVGFSLVAEPQTEAEYFCARMPKALQDQSAKIDFAEDVVTFTHPTEGSCSFTLPREDIESLQLFVNQLGPYKGKKYAGSKDGFLTPGFKITLEGEKGERGESILSNR